MCGCCTANVLTYKVGRYWCRVCVTTINELQHEVASSDPQTTYITYNVEGRYRNRSRAVSVFSRLCAYTFSLQSLCSYIIENSDICMKSKSISCGARISHPRRGLYRSAPEFFASSISNVIIDARSTAEVAFLINFSPFLRISSHRVYSNENLIRG